MDYENKIKLYKGIEVVFKCDENLKNVVYLLTFPNNKKYIGITTCLLKTRIYQHCQEIYNKKYSNLISKRAIKKYKTFSVDILYKNNINNKIESFKDLSERESFFIKSINTMSPYGYNLTSGGEGCPGVIVKESTKEKKRQFYKKNPMSKERIKEISNFFSKKVYQYDLNGNFIKEWESQKEIYNYLKINQHSIRYYINNNLSYNGYQFSDKFYIKINECKLGKEKPIMIFNENEIHVFKRVKDVNLFFEYKSDNGSGNINRAIRKGYKIKGFNIKKITLIEYEYLKNKLCQ